MKESFTVNGTMAVLINESGFYSLVLSSKMSKAKEFRRWVTSKVLSTVRKTGGYIANEDIFIENYLPFLDKPYQNLFRLQMMAINQLSDIINLIDINAMAKLAV